MGWEFLEFGVPKCIPSGSFMFLQSAYCIMSILGVVKVLLPILIPLHYVDRWIGFIGGVCQVSFLIF
jgi:uncharacterized membrane protein YkgB